MDRSATECYYEIDIDLETQLPKSIKKTVLTGVRSGESGKKNRPKIGSKREEHVAFHFTYKLTSFGEVDRFARSARHDHQAPGQG